jgi:hypothetical protein
MKREREREREGEREREREGERKRGREREREGERKRGRERCRICPELLFSFLKGMTGALAPLSYLVQYKSDEQSSLLVPSVSDEGKKFIAFAPDDVKGVLADGRAERGGDAGHQQQDVDNHQRLDGQRKIH